MVDVSVLNMAADDELDLPPGFRFHPTDEEIVTHYLSPKVINNSFSARAMGDVDLNKCEPWDLPGKARMGEKEWYFFCHKDRKYPTGTRTNRATEAGYWKATGKDKEIHRGRGVLVGMKKTLVFYTGRAPKGQKTNWVMHEYRLEGQPLPNIPNSVKDEWVVCRVFNKSMGLRGSPPPDGSEGEISLGDQDVFDSTTLPPLMEPPFINNDQSFEFKEAPPATISTMIMGMDRNSSQQAINHHHVSSNLLPQSPYCSFMGSANLPYWHQQDAVLMMKSTKNDASSSAIRKHCKLEQCSNQLIGSPSQDTGVLITDQNIKIYSELGNPSSSGAVIDLDNIMWKY